MRRFGLTATVALACSCGGTNSQTPGTPGTPGGSRTPLTAKDIVKRSSPAIVRIEAGNDKIGTGFILDKGGIVATNLHVIAGEATIRIKLSDGSQYPVLQITGLDPNRDLALLRIQPTRELPTLRLGDSNTMSAGDQVFAIGNPLGFDNSVTSGLISQVRPVCGPEEVATKHCEELTVLQISAAISPGSSGGPLFNQFGEVIGVTTAIILAGQNINLAVPGNYLRPLIAQHVAIPTDQFARQTKAPDDDDGVKIVRRVPQHELAVFDGCSSVDVGEVVHQIDVAIESGAPLYNDGKHEACFRIYEGTATKFERDAPCAGVRTAFGDGLLRAGGLSTFKEKAWAMRDTFDGLLDVAQRWAVKHPDSVRPEHKPDRRPPKPPRP